MLHNWYHSAVNNMASQQLVGYLVTDDYVELLDFRGKRNANAKFTYSCSVLFSCQTFFVWSISKYNFKTLSLCCHVAVFSVTPYGFNDILMACTGKFLFSRPTYIVDANHAMMLLSLCRFCVTAQCLIYESRGSKGFALQCIYL